MNFRMYFMHFRVYFVAYSVYSPTMGRYSNFKKILLAASCLFVLNVGPIQGRLSPLKTFKQDTPDLFWPPLTSL